MGNEADNFLDELLDDLEDTPGTPGNDPKPTEEPVQEPVSPTGSNDTKAYSERLKKDRDKLAKQLGYESWEDALEKRTESTLLDKGIDPDEVKPILKDLLKNDPDYIAAMEYKKSREEIEKRTWAENELKKLNEKFGLSIANINNLDKNVIDLWNGGLSLEKAYAAEHYEELRTAAEKKGAGKQTGKEHMLPPGTSGGGGDTSRKATEEEIRAFRRFNPNVSVEEINKYINRSK